MHDTRQQALERRTARIAPRWLGAAAASLVLLAATPALADHYEPDRAGHPLRIVAYVVHPIGVAIDYLILRPAHWVGEHEPFATIFGHRVD